MSGDPKRARGDLTPEMRAAVDAYWAAEDAAAQRIAYARMRWLGLPPGFGEAPDPINPPGWATLENVR